MHEYEDTFQGRPAHFRMTSVIGHVLRCSLALSAQGQKGPPADRAACAMPANTYWLRARLRVWLPC